MSILLQFLFLFFGLSTLVIYSYGLSKMRYFIIMRLRGLLEELNFSFSPKHSISELVSIWLHLGCTLHSAVSVLGPRSRRQPRLERALGMTEVSVAPKARAPGLEARPKPGGVYL